jgi:hypothetical protein
LITWEQSLSGSRARGNTPARRKEFRLAARDRETLLELIRTNDLLVTDALQLPQQPPTLYFDLSLNIVTAAGKGAIKVGGPRSNTGANEHPLYQRSILLVKELYRIVGVHDAIIEYEEPLRQRR